MMDEPRVFERVRRSFAAFLADNRDLLVIGANERSISHKLAECLQREFDDLSVDCEYNRMGEEPKKLLTLWTHGSTPTDLERKTVYPDIVVHERGTHDRNLLVIETKKSDSRQPHDKDIAKLTAFTERPYSYQTGLFVVVGVGGAGPAFSGVRCFRNGKDFTDSDSRWSDLQSIRYDE